MAGRGLVLLGVVLAVALYWFYSSRQASVTVVTTEDILNGVPVHPLLKKEGASLDDPRVIKIVDGVWDAVGYAFGNSILLEAPEGLIIVDTTERVDLAAMILREFRKISRKPIVAIVQTHNHGDHTYGTAGFIEDPNNPPEIWGHELMKSLTMEGAGIGPRRLRGSVQQFGSAIRWQQTGTGIYTHQALKYPVPPIFPDKLISADETKVTIGGLNLTFIYIPGESKDQVGIWLEERRVLLPADKIYRMYPNVYAIRGQPARDPNEWCASLAKLRSLKADYLVPSHFLPLEGAQRIYDHLTIYMSGMQFVHDQTVRYMNKGLHPDDTAKRIKLPQSLASHQYMQQVYGNTIWTSKGVYEQYVGWFNGDPVDLFPHTPLERGRRMIDLIGLSQLLSRAELALKDDPQWALELSSYVTTVHPDNSLARAIRGRAIRALAGAQTNHLARNFYLTAALDNHGLVDYSVNMTGIIDNIDMGSLLNILKVRVNADLTDGVNMTVVFHFSDTKETFQLLMLYSVLYITPLADTDAHLGDTYDAKITTTTQVWKDINLKRLTPVSAAESGALKIDGSLTSFRQFLSFFET